MVWKANLHAIIINKYLYAYYVKPVHSGLSSFFPSNVVWNQPMNFNFRVSD